MKSLSEIVEQHSGRRLDKWRHYLEIYERHLSGFRNRPVTLIEIGVNHGGSIDMWRAWLGAECRYVGVDINPACRDFEAEGVRIFIGDQSDPRFLTSLADTVGAFDILIDDGGHSMIQQWTTFECLYPRLSENGVYVCEDVHTSYFPDFGGGIRKRNSFIRRIRRKIDELNAWHYREEEALESFTRTTHSMHFYDSVVVIEKRPMEPPATVTRGDVELPLPPEQEGGALDWIRRQKRLIGFIRNRPRLYRFLLRIRDRLRARS